MNIEIVDNAATVGLATQLQKEILYNLSYVLARSHDLQNAHMFMSSPLHNNVEEPFVKHCIQLYNQIVYKLGDRIVGDREPSKSMIRAYANINIPGEQWQSDWHNDDGTCTFIYYPLQWIPSWGGGLEFTDRVVDYKFNRCVVFDAELGHRAMAHTAPHFRYSVAIKTKLRLKEK